MKMIMRFKLVYLLGFLLGITSCGEWTNQDKDTFIEDCQRTKFSDAYCDCALEKALDKYSTFDEMTADEENMAEILLSCIEEDRTKEDK